jgi:hypothetical protein
MIPSSLERSLFTIPSNSKQEDLQSKDEEHLSQTSNRLWQGETPADQLSIELEDLKPPKPVFFENFPLNSSELSLIHEFLSSDLRLEAAITEQIKTNVMSEVKQSRFITENSKKAFQAQLSSLKEIKFTLNIKIFFEKILEIAETIHGKNPEIKLTIVGGFARSITKKWFKRAVNELDPDKKLKSLSLVPESDTYVHDKDLRLFLPKGNQNQLVQFNAEVLNYLSAEIFKDTDFVPLYSILLRYSICLSM